MGIQTLQQFIETTYPNACVPVDLVKIGRNFAKRGNELRFRYDYKHNSTPFCLVIDGESCLDRLYGGFFVDWVCGGQWNNMVNFLTSLFQTVLSNNITPTVFLNGSTDSERFESWVAKQKQKKQNIRRVLTHVAVKGTPPPKMFWVPPICLQSCLRMVLRHLKINLVLTSYDHRSEIITYCHDYNCHGLLADDFEYFAFDPPRYFSSEQLKFTHKGCLVTKEYILNDIAKFLDLHPSCICILAALLGNHILTEEDLSSFHKTLCPNVKGEIPINILITAVVEFIRNMSSTDLNVIGELVFGRTAYKKINKLRMCVQYYINGSRNITIPFQTGEGSLKYSKGKDPSDSSNPKHHLQSADEYNTNNKKTENIYEKIAKTQDFLSSLKVSDEIVKTVEEKHQRGLISPWIFHVLFQKEFKVPVTLEDESSREFPPSFLLYRPLRRMVYGVLFNLNCQHCPSEVQKGGAMKEAVSDVLIKEWICTKDNAYARPDFVSASHLGWELPSLNRLWFDQGYNMQRLQAFLTCLRSNSPLMMNTSYVPPHFLILCCVLRYITSNPDMTVLQKHELDVFLVQAVDPNLSDAYKLQKMELPLVTVRGMQLASTFMLGVEYALFANDACGSPLSWIMCCPWLYFDGKLFHRKLLKANGAKNLIDLCENQIDQVAKVERMRTAILEGLNVQFAHPSLTPADQRTVMSSKFTPSTAAPSVPRLISSGRGRGFRVMSQGGQLEVAGVVVGSWGHNYGKKLPTCGRSMPPSQGVSVGNVNRPARFPTTMGRGLNINHTPSSGFGHALPGNKKQKNKKKVGAEKLLDDEPKYSQTRVKGVGRGCTVETDCDTIEVSKLSLFEEASEEANDVKDSHLETTNS